MGVFAALLVAMLGGGHALSAGQQASPDRPVVRITAERFSFTPSRVTLKVGDVVELRISSQDTAHGFRLVRERGADDLEDEGTDVVIPKRGSGDASVIFTADRVGRWVFECSRMCGAGHNFMRGEIVVQP
jgi:cytochrome c oxidase subunit 2